MKSLFPSVDGNERDRAQLLQWMEQLLRGLDELKDPDRVFLKGNKDRSGHFYQTLAEDSVIPQQGAPLEDVNVQLLELLKSHPYHTKYFLTNILPMASIPGILGLLTAALVNGNNLWDVYGPAGAEAEVRVVSMMSKLVGYDHRKSGGYTTWGGQGAVFSGLRLAIAKFDPDAIQRGVPGNFYVLASESAHYSALKAVEATGLGRDKLIRVRSNPDNSMNLMDLEEKLERVMAGGGVPVYIVATTGTTDAMGIDNVKGVYDIASAVAERAGTRRPHIHADSALGGFFAMFNQYDFERNPLGLKEHVLDAIRPIRDKMLGLAYADSLCFDFQKLGQTPYVTSLFMVKDASDFTWVDLAPEHTPYVGHRGYGDYHTGYTLECSRMSSSIAMLSALLAFGVEGYQRLLAQFVEVNLAIRSALRDRVPGLEIVNADNPGIITAFRVYPDGKNYADELAGKYTAAEIQEINSMNERLFEVFGRQRDRIFLGDTKQHLMVDTKDGYRVPIYASKVFVISPYTQPEDAEYIAQYIQDQVASVYAYR
ncbi:pyridoxal phosphate-dependent decarboxylase family protein [Alicyclobacillus contaminans]|uniref:pyridoxal phosphate-dependent decarboxylase family protein n=1 Tax=Alicyclobacillus contaminans TaxID=392016 RepID=UPI000409052E|nr:pyridoxal-dependent decarboxylase [Alicyclobacillus contaminans]